MLRLLIRVPGSVTIKATEQGTRLGVRGGCMVRNAEALRGPEAGRVALPGPFLFFSMNAAAGAVAASTPIDQAMGGQG